MIREVFPNIVIEFGNVTDDIVHKEIFIDDTYQWLGGHPKGVTVVDIGANCGMFSLLASLDNKVISFEPNPKNFEKLKKNIDLNNASDRIDAFQLGVGKRGVSSITDTEGGSRITESGEFKCFLVSLQDVIKFVGDIGFLKMDIEGSEFEAILELPDKYFKQIQQFAIEVHPDLVTKKEYDELISKLDKYFYLVPMPNLPEGGGILVGRLK